MTNAELIAKIKAEIERRIEELNKDKYISIDAQVCRTSELNYLLRFLSSLESERPEPYNPVYDEAYLNEKIKKATESWKGVDVDAMLAECRGYDEEKSEKPMELEEEIKRYYSDNFEYISSDQPTLSILTNIARHFTDWQKEQLMKEAVEAKVIVRRGVRGLDECKAGSVNIALSDFSDGQRVRIIIVKE